MNKIKLAGVAALAAFVLSACFGDVTASPWASHCESSWRDPVANVGVTAHTQDGSRWRITGGSLIWEGIESPWWNHSGMTDYQQGGTFNRNSSVGGHIYLVTDSGASKTIWAGTYCLWP